ncbi:MAG: ROK family protein [Thermoleophilia bacterium]|nr:ROK family protein [Thermoleophilia bacterium]
MARQAARFGGIDLGATKIHALVAGADGSVTGEARAPTPAEGLPEVVAAMAAALERASAAAGCVPGELAGVGVGAPGPVDADSGRLLSAGNLPAWDGPFPLAAALAERVGVPVRLGNDVQAAVEAENRLGAGRPFRSWLAVWWGTGVGGGLVLDGRPWVGRGAAGELGHVVVRAGGARCPCGRRGCLEAYAGRGPMEQRARRAAARGDKTRLMRLMERQGKARLASGVWAEALEAGDSLAVKIVERAVAALGTGIASVVNLLDLEAVVIGGGLGSRLGQPYAERIAGAMLPHLVVPDRPPAVHVSELGDRGAAIGASLLAQVFRGGTL